MSDKHVKVELIGNNAGGLARLVSQGSYEKKNAQGLGALKPVSRAPQGGASTAPKSQGK